MIWFSLKTTEQDWGKAAELPNCCQYQKISEKAPVFTGHQPVLPALDPIILEKSWQWPGPGTKIAQRREITNIADNPEYSKIL